MQGKVSFRGASGLAVSFSRVNADGPWARMSGLAVFAARESFGWRVFKVVELTGRPDDVRPLWALSEAEGYGADTVFAAPISTPSVRKTLAADLDAGLDPVCRQNSHAPVFAAAA